jgi:hypothetical protein
VLATVLTPVLELFPRVHAMVKARGSELAESTMGKRLDSLSEMGAS